MQPSATLNTSLILSVAVALTPSAQAQTKTLSLAQTQRGADDAVDFSGDTPTWRWAPDGKHLIRGRGDDAKWFDARTGEERPAQNQDTPSDDEETDPLKTDAQAALAALDTLDAKTAQKITKRTVTRSEDDSAAIFRHDETLYAYNRNTGALRLNITATAAELEDLSPDGTRLAYVSDNDLHVVDTRTGRTRALTSSGSENTFNGKLDWVYQEEIYGRGNFKGFWWSPTSTHIAFLSLDESDVHTFTVVDHIEKDHFRVKPEITKYPKAGDPNPTVNVGVADVQTGLITWIDLSKYRGVEPLVVQVGWDPTGEHVVFQVQDRIQTWLDLNAADADTGELTTWIRETSKGWVNVLEPPHWLDDGSFLWLSERTGWKHLYHYRPGGELVRAVTRGPWAIKGLSHVDETAGAAWFTATRDGAVNTNVYRSKLDGTGITRLTPGDGMHSTSFNEDRSLLIDRYSSLAQPNRVQLCDGETGEVLRELGAAEIPDWDKYLTSQWELHEVVARDGFLLDVALLKPVPFDESKQYPVWVPTYSGPNASTVRNRWNSSTWFQFLAQQGICVMQVNVSSASGKGQWSTERCYKRLLVQELKDLEDAIAWLTENPWADASRVGITGYSYGGSMSAFALTNSDKFALGIAGGGVYDWRMYDTIYTERYMSTPQKNPKGYDETSVLKSAPNLKGHLLLHCGAMDDNVHMQNTLQLAYALQKAGKQFDLMVYPQTRHGVRNPDLRRHNRVMEWEAIHEHLRPEGAEVSAPPAGSPATGS